MAPPQQKRVRTGCLKCRTRRRKCTEEKPRCQRCVAGGFECQYGTRLSFLQKNSFTVAPATQGEGSPAYCKVQFVNDAASSSEPEGARKESAEGQPAQEDKKLLFANRPPLQVETSQTSSPSEPTPSLLTPATDTRRSSAEVRTTAHGLGDSRAHGRSESDVDSTQRSTLSPGFQQTPKEDYEIALDVLLSLGNPSIGNEELQSSNLPITLPEQVPTDSLLRLGVNSPSGGVGKDTARALEFQITADREVQLLRYYRYEVAPWLDICDLCQPFGISVPCLATHNPAINYGILALAASTMPTTPDTESLSRREVTTLVSMCQAYSSLSTGEDQQAGFLCAVLAKTRDQIRNQDNGDKPGLWPDHDLLRVLTRATRAGSIALLAAPIYYLALRLELSSALLNETSLTIPLHLSMDLHMDWQISELAAKVFIYASELLILCARAANLAAGEVPTNSLGQQETLVTAWTTLAENLTSWYTSRPQECKPVAETDGAGEAFPILFFTSGAGVLGNQLYHTAMLLLLQNRPRTVKLGTQSRPSTTMSPLWHAQRICGIALNNDRRECWDPSLVSSFVVAARIMTHEAQHQAVLEGLDKIEHITGWSMGRHKDNLKSEWGHEEDVSMMDG